MRLVKHAPSLVLVLLACGATAHAADKCLAGTSQWIDYPSSGLATTSDGVTPRVVDAMIPSAAFPTYGGPEGGYEVYISEGYAHVDVLTAEDDATNQVIAPLAAFVARNVQ